VQTSKEIHFFCHPFQTVLFPNVIAPAHTENLALGFEPADHLHPAVHVIQVDDITAVQTRGIIIPGNAAVIPSRAAI